MTSPIEARFATVEDVTGRYLEGDIPEAQHPWIRQRIHDVENRLIALCPWLAAADLPAVVLANARSVVAEVVLRLYRNPGGKRSQTTASGFSYTNFDHSAGQLTFTDEELESVRLPSVGSWSGFGSVDLNPWMH